MNYSHLKEEIEKIIGVTDSLPDRYKEISFNILLQHYMNGLIDHKQPKKSELGEGGDQGPRDIANKIPITTALRLFMTRNEINDEILNRVLLFENGEVHFIRKPANVSIAEGQIQWALLLSLKNAILNKEFKVDPEDVRSRCQEEAFYDPGNFTANFRRQNNSRFFKGLLTANGEAQALTNDGEIELARIVVQLSGVQK